VRTRRIAVSLALFSILVLVPSATLIVWAAKVL
jgi:hypothetical protein